MKLVVMEDDVLVDAAVGMELTDFRGDKAILLSWSEPHKPSSSGRVYIRNSENNSTSEYYPGVFGAKFIESEESK